MDFSKIDEKLMDRICFAARIKLTAEEKKKYLKQLEDILKAFKELDEIDTGSAEPAFHPMKIRNVMREDEARKWSEKGWDPLGNTPKTHKENGQFKSPRVV